MTNRLTATVALSVALRASRMTQLWQFFSNDLIDIESWNKFQCGAEFIDNRHENSDWEQSHRWTAGTVEAATVLHETIWWKTRNSFE